MTGAQPVVPVGRRITIDRVVVLAMVGIAMGLTLALFGSWQLVMLVDYTKDIYKRIPALFS